MGYLAQRDGPIWLGQRGSRCSETAA